MTQDWGTYDQSWDKAHLRQKLAVAQTNLRWALIYTGLFLLGTALTGTIPRLRWVAPFFLILAVTQAASAISNHRKVTDIRQRLNQ